MHEHFDFTDYARRVRKVSRTLMSSVRSGTEIPGHMHLLTVAAEKDLASFGDPPGVSRVACGPGCGACCVLNVSVLIPEAITIGRFLQRRFAPAEQQTICRRLKELDVKTSWVDDEDRVFMREPCAFLDNQGSCMIHVVRPLLCRAITSTDPVACRDGIAMAPLDGAPSVEMDLFQKNLVDTVYCELGKTLEELGLDHRPRRLSSSVHALLGKPELVDLFISGEHVPIH